MRTCQLKNVCRASGDEDDPQEILPEGIRDPLAVLWNDLRVRPEERRPCSLCSIAQDS